VQGPRRVLLAMGFGRLFPPPIVMQAGISNESHPSSIEWIGWVAFLMAVERFVSRPARVRPELLIFTNTAGVAGFPYGARCESSSQPVVSGYFRFKKVEYGMARLPCVKHLSTRPIVWCTEDLGRSGRWHRAITAAVRHNKPQNHLPEDI